MYKEALFPSVWGLRATLEACSHFLYTGSYKTIYLSGYGEQSAEFVYIPSNGDWLHVVLLTNLILEASSESH
jgi:hypothetical protein